MKEQETETDGEQKPSAELDKGIPLTSHSAMELEQIVKDPALSDARKQQKTMQMRKSEVNFLRFLRTHEKPGNYSTLKIIGKGAFGEVKLVQRKNDGKIYALKSLIKAEMVSRGPNGTLDNARLSPSGARLLSQVQC